MVRRLAALIAVSIGLALAQPCLAAVPPLTQPDWKELNTEQQRILAPLSGEWNNMSPLRRKKWLGIAQRYPSLSGEEQARMQRRMTDWAKLTPEERKLARDKYRSLQKAPPERKEAVKQKWQEYKELPDSEKARLQAEAKRKGQPRPPSRTPLAPPTAQPTPRQPPPAQTPPPAATPASPPPVVTGTYSK